MSCHTHSDGYHFPDGSQSLARSPETSLAASSTIHNTDIFNRTVVQQRNTSIKFQTSDDVSTNRFATYTSSDYPDITFKSTFDKTWRPRQQASHLIANATILATKPSQPRLDRPARTYLVSAHTVSTRRHYINQETLYSNKTSFSSKRSGISNVPSDGLRRERRSVGRSGLFPVSAPRAAKRPTTTAGELNARAFFPGLLTNKVSSLAGLLAAGLTGLVYKSLMKQTETQDRIFRGAEAEPHSWPWIAKIKVGRFLLAFKIFKIVPIAL